MDNVSYYADDINDIDLVKEKIIKTLRKIRRF